MIACPCRQRLAGTGVDDAAGDVARGKVSQAHQHEELLGGADVGRPVTSAAGSEIRVSSGATAVFFDNVSGTSAFTGSRTVIFEGSAGDGALERTGATVVGASGAVVVDRVRETSLEINGSLSILPNGNSASTSRVQLLAIAGGIASALPALDDGAAAKQFRTRVLTSRCPRPRPTSKQFWRVPFLKA